MGIFTLILNSLVLFIVSNTYILEKTYDLKLPLIFMILFIPIICIFPSLLNKELESKKLSIVRDGYRLLIMFLINIIIDIHLYIMIMIKYGINTQILLKDIYIFSSFYHLHYNIII